MWSKNVFYFFFFFKKIYTHPPTLITLALKPRAVCLSVIQKLKVCMYNKRSWNLPDQWSVFSHRSNWVSEHPDVKGGKSEKSRFPHGQHGSFFSYLPYFQIHLFIRVICMNALTLENVDIHKRVVVQGMKMASFALYLVKWSNFRLSNLTSCSNKFSGVFLCWTWTCKWTHKDIFF